MLGSIEMLEYVNTKLCFTIDVVRVFASAAFWNITELMRVMQFVFMMAFIFLVYLSIDF